MSKSSVTAVVGSTYFSGNSMRPALDTLVRFDSWLQLSDKEREGVRTIEYWKSSTELASREYARYTTRGARGSRVTSRGVFEATRYASHDDMVSAYLAG